MTPNPAIESIFEAIRKCDDHDEYGNATTHSPEISSSAE